MEYVTSWERNGIKRGALQMARENVLGVLETRFGTIDASVSDAINRIDNVDALKQMCRQAAVVAVPEEVLEEAGVRPS